MAQPISRRQFLAASAMAGTGLFIPRKMQAAQVHITCPILMYHYVGELPLAASSFRHDLTVSPTLFATHLDMLLSDGFTVVSLDHLYAALLAGAPLPDKPVVLTFDDGYADAYLYAAPMLSERGLTGTFFIVTHFMDHDGYLTWAQAAEMQTAGMVIGNHSATHSDLTAISHGAQLAEIDGTATLIEQVLGMRPRFYAYPIGRHSLGVRRITARSGHVFGLTTRDGTVQYNNYPYSLSRIRVRGTTTPIALQWLVNRQAW